jgi:hypothetical protein
MHRILHIPVVSYVSLLSVCLLAGCSGGSSSDATAKPTTAPNETSAASAKNDAPDSAVTDVITRAAEDFLDAVLKGDSERASARLTPQALQRINESGTPFAPPGLASATYRIGEVRTPSPDQAIVQCVLTDTNAGQSEEMCCLLRRVESDWRVSGIAYGSGPEQPWMLSDFESGRNMTIPREANPAPSAAPSHTVAPSRPSPRTAQEGPATTYQ